ncbi:MAG: GAF domain-containing protein, partial [Cyanobacteria bacterium P01_F01_bin.86]
MKFFKLDASPTVQWMKQVVTGESSATDAPSDNPLTPSPMEVDDPSQRPKNNTPKDSTTPLNSQPTDSSDSDDTQTSSTQEIIMQKPKKSEQPLLTFPTPPTSNTLLKSSNGNDATARDVNGTSEALLKNTDLQWLLSLSQYLHQADELATLLDAVVTEVGQRFQVDRALVYQFQTETEGVVLAESLTAGYTPSLNETLAAVAFGAKLPREAQNQVISIHDVTQASLSPHQHQIVERFQIKASLSIPIFLDQTWGLLVVQQCARSQPWSDKDLTLLYKVATELRLALQTLELRQEKLKTEEYKQELPAIIHKISNPAYVENACQTAVQEVRRVLGAERVAIYKFRSDYFGDFMYESESGGWPALVGSAWEDPYLQENKGGRFQDDEPYVADDVYSKGLTDCHLEALEYFGVKSFIVVPIKQGEKLWGLLSAFQHSGPRHWLGREITLMTEVGRQLGVTLQGADYLMRLQEQSAQSAQFTQINQLVAEIIPKIFQAQDLATVFQTANQSIRRLLKCDRVAIYQFHSDWSSELVAERTTKGMDALENANLGAIWPKTNIQATRGGPYLNRENLVVNNIHTAGLAAEQIEELADFEVQAFMVTPIFKGDELWGLLGAYQNNKPRSWAAVEISALEQIAARVGMAMQQVDYLQQIEDTSKQIARAAEQEGLITKIVDRIRQSFDLQQAFDITSREIRNFLEADRVAIFRFLPGTKYSKGKTIAEDVRPGYVSALEVEVIDHCFSQGFAEKYRRGHVSVIADINKAGIKQCYIDVLAQFQVQANLVVPLMRGDDLWGLFCIHQCESPREWTVSDIDFAKRIAAQLDIAIQQGEYLEQVQTKSAQLSKIAEQEQLITKIVDRIRQPLSMQQAFNTTTREIRSFLKADRVAIFKFVPGTKYSRGKTIA